MLVFKVSVVLLIAVSSAMSLMCYTGFTKWDHIEPQEGNLTVTLENCAEDDGCCERSHSLPGSTYKCVAASACPDAKDFPQCGKQLDSGWCFCKDHEDENCSPSRVSDLNRVSRDADVGIINNTAANENENSVLPTVQELQCYVGSRAWQDGLESNTISVQTCSQEHKCCKRVHSLMGSTYSCISDCPDDWSTPCGPNPEEHIMDVGWCHCKDHKDENCTPSQFKSKPGQNTVDKSDAVTGEIVQGN